MKKLDFKWAVVCGNSDFQRLRSFLSGVGYTLHSGYTKAQDMDINTHIICTFDHEYQLRVGRARLENHPEVVGVFYSVEDFINAHFTESQNETSEE